MLDKKLSIRLRATLAIFTLSLFVTGACAAEVLHNFFGNREDGSNPEGSLIFDAAGNLYGTTAYGGPDIDKKHGTVFELTPNADGSWTKKDLHDFGRDPDGVSPVASLVFDSAGNLYGTTITGGHDLTSGIVFELMPNGDGSWTENILRFFFPDGPRGSAPADGLIFDSMGNLYGTTTTGSLTGVVFELKPKAGGTWTEKVLHSFSGGNQGSFPYAGLILDAAGNLYGTTAGTLRIGEDIIDYGTVFELMPSAGGGWDFKILHEFKNDGKDGFTPVAGLTFDADGNLYGTTYGGGNFGGGTAFELTPNADGTWTEKILHKFKNDGKDGYSVRGGLTFDSAGSLYGTTVAGGSDNMGTVFKLTPTAEGRWTEKIVHNFKNDGKDGNAPFAGVIIDASGNLYGTTRTGGTHNGGTVFKITP